MSGKSRFLAAVLAFILLISCGLFTSTATPEPQENGAGEAEDSPEAAAQRSFKAFAPIPNRSLQIQELSNDHVYATVQITAEFRDSVDSPWIEKEATVECQKVGEAWRCDETFDFQLTPSARGTMVAGQIAGALTSTIAVQITATQQAKFDAICGFPEVQTREEAVVHLIEIGFWPEYDRPGVLVIYHIRLSSFVALPAELAITIPANAELNAVAMQDARGALLNAAYTQTDRADGTEITLTTDSSYVQIEYYDLNLAIDGHARHFEYQWLQDFPVDNLFVAVQQPANALDMQLLPEMTGPGLMSDGRYYYCDHLGDPANRSVPPRITIDYEIGG